MIRFDNADVPAAVELVALEYGDAFAMKTGDGSEHIYLKFEQTSFGVFKCFDMNKRVMEMLYPDTRVQALDITIRYSYMHDLTV